MDNSFFIWELENGYKNFSRVFEFPTNFLTWADINYNEKFPSYTICHANINNINCYYFFYEISSMQYSMKTNKFTLPSTGNIVYITVINN